MLYIHPYISFQSICQLWTSEFYYQNVIGSLSYIKGHLIGVPFDAREIYGVLRVGIYFQSSYRTNEWRDFVSRSGSDWLAEGSSERGGSKSQLSRLYFFSFNNCFRRTRGKYDKTKIYNLKRWFYMIHHISKQRQQLRFYLRVIVSNSEIPIIIIFSKYLGSSSVYVFIVFL